MRSRDKKARKVWSLISIASVINLLLERADKHWYLYRCRLGSAICKYRKKRHMMNTQKNRRMKRWTNKEAPRGVEGEKKEREKKALMWQSWPGILMRSHSDSGIRVRSSHCGCQITPTPQQEIWARMRGERGRIINSHPLGRQREQR